MYIRFFGNGHLWFRSYSGSLLKSAKVTKTLLPHHSAPRLGSVCPNAGIAPWAAAKGHPWPSAATSASMPRCPLRNACVRPSWLTGRPRSKATRGGLIAGLVWGERIPPVGAGLFLPEALYCPSSPRCSITPKTSATSWTMIRAMLVIVLMSVSAESRSVVQAMSVR